MGQIHRESANLYIIGAGVPDEWTGPQKKSFLDQLAATGIPHFQGSYEEAQEVINRGAAPAGEAPIGTGEDAVYERQRQLEEEVDPPISRIDYARLADAEAAAAAAPPEPEKPGFFEGTDVAGSLGALVRGAAPIATGAAAGFALGGPPGAAIGAGGVALANNLITPLLNTTLNSIFGTELQNPRDLLERFFTNIGVAKPDSRAEQVAQQMAESAATAMGVGAAAGAGAGGMPSLNAGARAMQETLGRLVPGLRDYIGAAFGPAGGAAAEEAAVALGAERGGPVATGANIVGDIATDVATGGITDLVTAPRTATEALAGRTMRGLPPLEPDVSAGLRYADEAGLRVTTSDVRYPPSAPPPEGFFSKMIAGGSQGRLNRERQMERIGQLRDVFRSMGVGDFSDRELSRALESGVTENYLKVRGQKLDDLWSTKAGIRAELNEADVSLLTESAAQIAEDEVQRLSRIPMMGEAGAKVTGFRDQLLHPNDIDGLESLRRSLGDIHKDVGSSYDPTRLTEAQKQVQQSTDVIYEALSKDIQNNIADTLGDDAYQAWTSTNSEISTLLNDFSEAVVTDLLKKPEDLSVARAAEILYSGDPAKTRRLTANLDADGMALAKEALLTKIAQESTPGITDLSPTQAANQIARRANELGVVLDEPDHDMLKGLMKYLNLTTRAEGAAVRTQHPLTEAGRALGPGGSYQLARQTTGAAGAAVTGIASFTPAVVSRIYDSPTMRNLFIELGEKGSSARTNQLIRQITRTATNQLNEMELERATGEPAPVDAVTGAAPLPPRDISGPISAMAQTLGGMQ